MNWKINKKKVLTILLALIVAAGLVWRLVPRSFSRVIFADADAISSLTCTATTTGIAHGAPDIAYYSLPTLNAGDAQFDEIMELLTQTAYRPDFRNLLPWSTTVVVDDVYGADIIITWDSAEGERCTISYLAEDIIRVRTAHHGSGIYHPTDRDVLPLLVEYIQTHGTKTA